MIITLISDFGDNSPYPSWAESILYERFPSCRVIHITHKVAPFKILQAAYLWKCSTDIFPSQSFHISLTDLILSLPAAVMLTQHQGHYYLGMDNGLLSASFGTQDTGFYIFNEVAASFKLFMEHSCTAIASIIAEGLESHHFLPYHPLRLYEFPKVANHGDAIDCFVIFIDNYGNAITNLCKDEFESIRKDRDYEIAILRNETISQITDTYRSSDSGGVAAYFNEFGYLQISMKSKNAQSAAVLGLLEYHQTSLLNNLIKIRFK